VELFLFFSRVFIRSSLGCRPRRSLSGFFRDTSEEEEGKKKKVSEIAERCNDRRGAKSGRGGSGRFMLTEPSLSSPHIMPPLLPLPSGARSGSAGSAGR
jgi:hypothetical protein